jgi:ubiquinone biosynthesis protein UbiJ
MRAPWPRSCARLEQQVERLQKRVQELERKLDKQPPH